MLKNVYTAIALGSNLGDSLTILENALAKLQHLPSINLISCSSWYRTKAIGPPQNDYLNGCAILNVDLSPSQLLKTLQEIEQLFGRVRQERWGPRTIDLDLVLYNDTIVNTPELKIPHPRLRERAFVLVPLAEIVPHWIEPLTKKSIAQLREAVDCSGVQLYLPL